MSDRYMTPLGKVHELEGWVLAKKKREEEPPKGFVGGHGFPDPEIYDWVDRLNKLQHLCTLQSCAGHRCTKESHCDGCEHDWAQSGFWPGDGGQFAEPCEHLWSGQFWLWPDELMARWFERNAFALALLPTVEKLAVLYHIDGMFIIDVQFKGAGHGQLEESMTDLCAFFETADKLCE